MMLFVIQSSVSLNNTHNKNFKKCSMQQKCFILNKLNFFLIFINLLIIILSFCLQLNFLIAEKLLMQIWVLINVNLRSVSMHKCTQQCITKQNLLKAFKIISKFQNIHVFQFKCTNAYVHIYQQITTTVSTCALKNQHNQQITCANNAALF